MSILSGPRIKELVGAAGVPRIGVDPFDPTAVGPNSIDLRLGPTLCEYTTAGPISVRKDNPTRSYTIHPEAGIVLFPSRLYLGHTLEKVGAWGLVPCIETRSSMARLGISTHLSAGFGDESAFLSWTLEITVQRPVRIYAGIRICQIYFHTLEGERKPYAGKYQGDTGPVPSRSHLEWGIRADAGPPV